MKTYVTFGQDHIHRINGTIFDSKCVAVIEGEDAENNRAKAFNLFGPRFAFEYPEDYFDMGSMRFYPRGLINVE